MSYRNLSIELVVVTALAFGMMGTGLEAQSFVNATAGTGIVAPPYPFSGQSAFGRGCAWADFDGDGDHDLFLAEGVSGDYVIWWNAQGVFTKQIVMADPGNLHHDHQVVSADFDNDGDQDVYVAVGSYQPNLLFVNQGGGVFVEDAAARGVAHPGDSYTANWGDVDRDGWLDLYVAARHSTTLLYGHNVLFRNNGDGTFSDVTTAAGVASPGHALASLIHDVDGDGWPEIIVGNDKGALGPPAAFLRNERNGSFSDVSVAWNGAAAVSAMGITVGDLHNGGGRGWDVFMTDDPAANLLLDWDDATGAFLPQTTWDDHANLYGFNCSLSAWACFFADLDHDCDLDLIHTELGTSPRLHRNDGGAPFTEITAAVGLAGAAPPAYSACLVDYDDDGDLDLFLPGGAVPAMLFENTADQGTWLQISLQGTNSNRDGLGTVAIVKTGPITQRRAKLSGEGYLSDGDRRLHFGMGGQSAAQRVELRWPSGTVHYLSNVAANQILNVVEPSFQIAGSLAPGTANSVTLTLPDDAFIPYACGLTTNVYSQFDLGDGRAILTDVNDPLLALTTIPGNSGFVNSVGFFDATGTASMTLNIPPVPALSGFSCWMIGVTWHPSFVSNIKSIVGPQRIVIP
jgi:ASPIC and UnbV/FG-GAP-like repeat